MKVLIPAVIMMIAFYNLICQHQDQRIPTWSVAVYWLFVTIYWFMRVVGG